MSGRHAGEQVSLDDADGLVLLEFVKQDARSGFRRTYAQNALVPLTDAERAVLPPLAFEDETLRVLIDVNKGFPEPPVRRTYGVLRELLVLRPPTDDEAETLRRAGLPGPGRFDVIDEAVFDHVFPGKR